MNNAIASVIALDRAERLASGAWKKLSILFLTTFGVGSYRRIRGGGRGYRGTGRRFHNNIVAPLQVRHQISRTARVFYRCAAHFTNCICLVKSSVFLVKSIVFPNFRFKTQWRINYLGVQHVCFAYSWRFLTTTFERITGFIRAADTLSCSVHTSASRCLGLLYVGRINYGQKTG